MASRFRPDFLGKPVEPLVHRAEILPENTGVAIVGYAANT
jgi:hypothetical protein